MAKSKSFMGKFPGPGSKKAHKVSVTGVGDARHGVDSPHPSAPKVFMPIGLVRGKAGGKGRGKGPAQAQL